MREAWKTAKTSLKTYEKKGEGVWFDRRKEMVGLATHTQRACVSKATRTRTEDKAVGIMSMQEHC